VHAWQDSGGFTKSGEVPEAEPISISSERELRAEVDNLIKNLHADVDWTKRIQAMLRLEGLIKGGAYAMPVFLDLARTLQDAIITQLLDRQATQTTCTVLKHGIH
jgi:hypothetical protein